MILFDLDGTLTDSQKGITGSIQYALEKFGIPAPDQSELVKFIGPPLKESFEEHYQVDGALAVKYYRERFVDQKAMLENEVYPGVIEMLKALKDHGKTLAVATAKPTVYSRIILEHFELWPYFSDLQGSELDMTLTEKSDVIRVLLARWPQVKKENITMVGDRGPDMIGAKENGIRGIGVTYGYGSRKELEETGASEIVSTAQELIPILI